MHCPSCDFLNPEDIKFCGKCRTPLKGCCPQFGIRNPLRFVFCGDCGAPLSVPAQALSPTPVPSSIRSARELYPDIPGREGLSLPVVP